MAKQYQTLNILAGSFACDGNCPPCIAKMTNSFGINYNPDELNVPRFQEAYCMAARSRISTVKITSKGEPMLYCEQITLIFNYLLKFESETKYRAKTRELQTNGRLLSLGHADDHLHLWKAAGLDIISISIVHYEPEMNRQFFFPLKKSYFDLPGLINRLHNIGFKVRLATTLFNEDGGINTVEKLQNLISFASSIKADQLTMRPVDFPKEPHSSEEYKWAVNHRFDNKMVAKFRQYLESKGRKDNEFPFGSSIYKINGLSLYFGTCLTEDEPGKKGRQIIFAPNGTIAHSWV